MKIHSFTQKCQLEKKKKMIIFACIGRGGSD